MSHLTICLIICVLTMASYIWGKLPMGLTAMLSMVAFIVTGCLKASTAAAYFGNANGIMIVAMFIVAAGFNRTQFVKKCAASVNKIAKGSLTRVMLGYVLIARRAWHQPLQGAFPDGYRQHRHCFRPAPRCRCHPVRRTQRLPAGQ